MISELSKQQKLIKVNCEGSIIFLNLVFENNFVIHDKATFLTSMLSSSGNLLFSCDNSLNKHFITTSPCNFYAPSKSIANTSI
jgi:hypothetical protein